MARSVSIATLIALSASAANAQSADKSTRNWTMAPVPQLPDVAGPPTQPGFAKIIAGTDIAPQARFGFGFFGMKQDKASSPVTVREFSAPRKRQAAVGFSLKF